MTQKYVRLDKKMESMSDDKLNVTQLLASSQISIRDLQVYTECLTISMPACIPRVSASRGRKSGLYKRVEFLRIYEWNWQDYISVLIRKTTA
jgi:hypothetical protein